MVKQKLHVRTSTKGKKFLAGSKKIVKKKKISKRNKLISFVKQQINLDLNEFINEKWSKRNYLIIDFKNMSRQQQHNLKILELMPYSIYRIEDCGGLGKALVYNEG